MNLRPFVLIALLFAASCANDRKDRSGTAEQKESKKVYVPTFNADSAYQFVQDQVDFGPRIPNTKAHEETAQYLTEKLKRYGAQVTVQEFVAEAYDGRKLNLKNLIGSFYPAKSKRILLAAHWDTRPFADKDSGNPSATFQGANDGASGVGVLLEIARAKHSATPPDVGIDIIFFDGEDWGEKEGEQGSHQLPEALDEWWCLGSQYWAKNKHKPNYSAYYGILLDMVGAKNAQFHQEGYSMEYAPAVVEKVWDQAHRLGYSHVFVRKTQPGVTDDHVFVNTIARIPMINIVHFEPGIGYFGNFHHTQKDNMDLISKQMLDIVGTTVLNVIYHEQ